MLFISFDSLLPTRPRRTSAKLGVASVLHPRIFSIRVHELEVERSLLLKQVSLNGICNIRRFPQHKNTCKNTSAVFLRCSLQFFNVKGVKGRRLNRTYFTSHWPMMTITILHSVHPATEHLRYRTCATSPKKGIFLDFVYWNSCIRSHVRANDKT